MSKLEIIALSGVVYKVKSTGTSTEPCGTTYESVTLSEKVSLIFYGLEPILQIRRKPNLSLARYSIPIRKSIC